MMKNSQFCITFLLLAFAFTLFLSCAPGDEARIAVYNVEKSGVDRDVAEKFVNLLPIDPDLIKEDNYLDENGRISIIDTNRYFVVPTKTVGREASDEDGHTVIAEALDIDSLRSIQPIDSLSAQKSFLQALDSSTLLPNEGKTMSRYNKLVLVDDGENILERAINTRVAFSMYFGETPVHGPGAKINVNFSPDNMVSRLKYAHRITSRGEMVTQMSEARAIQLLKESYESIAPPGGYQDLEIEPYIFYYAPSLSQKGVKTIIPYYGCVAQATIEDRRISLLQRSIPAITDTKYVPTINLKADVTGEEVNASVDVVGGSRPYQIRWHSPSFGAKTGESEITYVLKRRGDESQEILTVDVTDANGVYVQSAHIVKFDSTTLPDHFNDVTMAMGGVRDYGTENPVYNQFGGLEQGFIDQMDDDGVTRRFSWRGLAAWEQDFKEPEDDNWIDNTDITFYVGHGNVGYFTFEAGCCDDAYLDNNDATGDWGDKDLEWLALYSCQVLGRGADGQEPFRNWKQEFDGLHLLLGFHTNAQANFDFANKFASDMVDANMTVLCSWLDAVDDHQPDDRVGIVMGVLRASDNVWNFCDHFHGKGAVGPDIRGDDIGPGWYAYGP